MGRRSKRYNKVIWSAILFASAVLVYGSLAQEAPTGDDSTPAVGMEAASTGTSEISESETSRPGARRQGLVASLTIFVLAVFVGFEVITKVPPTLHTPLMSGSNAISGISIVGAVIVASSLVGGVSNFFGFVAVTLATINAVGGFLVTHRMLAMFKR